MFLEKCRKDYKTKGYNRFNIYLEQFCSSYHSLILDLDGYTKIFPSEFYKALGREDIRKYVSVTSLDLRKNKNGVLCLTLEIFPSQPSKINFLPFCLICYPTDGMKESIVRGSCINAFIPAVRNTLSRDKKIYFDPLNNIQLLRDIFIEKNLIWLWNEVLNNPVSDILCDKKGNISPKDMAYAAKFLYKLKYSKDLNLDYPEYDLDYIVEKTINSIL